MPPEQYHVRIDLSAFTWVTQKLWLSKAVGLVELVAPVHERIEVSVVRCGAPGIGGAPRSCIHCNGEAGLVHGSALNTLDEYLRDHIKDVYGEVVDAS